MKEDALKNLITPGTSEEIVRSYESLSTRAKDTAFGLDEEEVVILDIETTGFSVQYSQIIEIAGAVLKGTEVVEEFSSFVKPNGSIPEEITALTGITDAMVQDAPSIDRVIMDFKEFVGDRDLVAHNAAFDRSFLEHALGEPFSGTWFDSLVVARIALPRLNSHKLSELADAFCDGRADHRATSDVAALVQLWRVCLVALSDLPAGLLHRIVGLHPSTQWPERKALAHIAAQNPQGHFDLHAARSADLAADKEPPREDVAERELTFPPKDVVCDEFSAGGIVGCMYDSYEPRAEQVEMAGEVLEAFSTRTHRAIEAGTGVGKSIAYLVPAALFAQQNEARVGVATKTNALLDQLIYHELPLLSGALDRPLRYVALKGYDHYPCLYKMERYAREDGAEPDNVSMLAMMYSWVAQSPWGDLDSINLFWPKLSRDSIVATQGECLKKNCRFFPHLCYLHGVRRRAESADIVVTNHALLFRDMEADNAILPPIRHWIIDEAHAAEAEARKQLALRVSHSELAYALASLQSKRGGILPQLGKRAKSLPGADVLSGPLGKLEQHIPRASVLTDSFFSFVKDLGALDGGSAYDWADIWISDELRQKGAWGAVVSAGQALVEELTAIVKTLGDLLSFLATFERDLSEAQAATSGLAMRLSGDLSALSTILDGEKDELVYSASIDRRPQVRAEELLAFEFDIGSTLASELYPSMHSVVFTSATIATGESFEFFAHSVGLDRIDRELWSPLRLPSSYDFENNMRVYAPRDIPAPNEPGYIKALERFLLDIHVAMGGSVLTLFTNRREMEQLYTALKDPLAEANLDLRCQTRQASGKRLRDEFLSDEGLSLFALRTFWEGFDAPGDTLRCVVIPKLPFGRPTDPLACERRLREPESAWSKYVLPTAIIDVKQAAGRLIRSSSDRGSLVIADSRVVTKQYGRRFLEALPVRKKELESSREIVSDLAGEFGDGSEKPYED